MKLVVNTMIMGTMAILGGTPEQVLKDNGPDFAQKARAWFLNAGEEALFVGQSLNYKIVPVFGLKQEDVTNTNSLLETLLDKILHDIGPSAVNTILQDYMKGRYSEVDLIYGQVAAECKKHGRDAPFCDAIVDLDRRIHAGELKPGPDNLALALQ
jgi:2-dehydropantoate 2-reductase